MAATKVLVILGATASGKTRLGVAAARRLQGEIISADSRQVFRGLDLGSGKDLAEYGAIPCHLIDIRNPGEPFSVFDFQHLCQSAVADIAGRGRLPIVVGGTGLYLDAVLRSYRLVEVGENVELRAELALLDDAQLRDRLLTLRPDQHNRTDLDDRARLLRAIEIAGGTAATTAELPPAPELDALVVGVRWERAELRRRIATRLRERLGQGLVDEVAGLQRQGVDWAVLEGYGLEYRYVARHLQGQLNRNDMVQQLASAIAEFAKRQETWFRRMERQGVTIHWLDGAVAPEAALFTLLAASGWLKTEDYR